MNKTVKGYWSKFWQ